jgi:hypothetical protein
MRRRECRCVLDDVLRYIKRNLLRDTLGGEEACFGHIGVKSSVLMEDTLEVSQDMKRHAYLSLDLSIVSISKRDDQEHKATFKRKILKNKKIVSQ